MPEHDRLADLRALKTANVDMAFATAFATLVGGNFQQAFALDLGATPRMLALLAALPAVIGMLQVPGSMLGERFASYKKFAAVGGLFWRLAWVPIVALPLAPVFYPRLSLLIAAIVISGISIFLVQATYNAWLSFLVPDSHRGYYFSRRIALATVVSAAIGFPASMFLDWMDRSGEFSLGLSILFGIGVVCGLISYFFYLRMPDTKHPVVEGRSLKSDFRGISAPLKDRNFVRLLIFLVVFVVGQTLAAPFFFPYGREVLKLEFTQFQIFGAFHAAASLLSAPMWGYFSDKYGNKPVLFASGLLISLGPLSWVFCNASLGNWNILILIIGHTITGFSWTGVAVGQGNIILANSSPELRSASNRIIASGDRNRWLCGPNGGWRVNAANHRRHDERSALSNALFIKQRNARVCSRLPRNGARSGFVECAGLLEASSQRAASWNDCYAQARFGNRHWKEGEGHSRIGCRRNDHGRNRTFGTPCRPLPPSSPRGGRSFGPNRRAGRHLRANQLNRRAPASGGG
ncbi:MAG: MFS transporter [Armatimonadota bacterium]|nr:MFS transporter [Armatimonadota bacterium]